VKENKRYPGQQPLPWHPQKLDDLGVAEKAGLLPEEGIGRKKTNETSQKQAPAQSENS